MSTFDIVFINDGANSFYRSTYFSQTSYVENIQNNICRYGLVPNISSTDNELVRTCNPTKNIDPLAYGLILIYDIENKNDFQEKFKTEDKLEKKIDFDSILNSKIKIVIL